MLNICVFSDSASGIDDDSETVVIKVHGVAYPGFEGYIAGADNSHIHPDDRRKQFVVMLVGPSAELQQGMYIRKSAHG